MNAKIKPVILSFLDIMTTFFLISIFANLGEVLLYFISFINNANSSASILSDPQTVELLSSFLQSAMIIIIPLFIWKHIKNNSLERLGLKSFKKSIHSFLGGLLLGILSISFCFICINIFGSVEVSFSETIPFKDCIIYLLLFILVGFSEEILVRGYALSTISSNKINYAAGIIITSVIFAGLHLRNDSINLLSFINLTLVGILYAYMRLKTDSLWMCIGSHITWNYFQGIIYGFNVSGRAFNSVLKVSLNNNTILNGGGFGMEGSIFCTLVILLQIIGLYFISQQKNKQSIA